MTEGFLINIKNDMESTIKYKTELTSSRVENLHKIFKKIMKIGKSRYSDEFNLLSSNEIEYNSA